MAAVLRTRDARVSGPFVLGLFGAEGFSAEEDPFVVLARPGRRVHNVDFDVADDGARGRYDAKWEGLPVVTPTLACLDAAHPRFEIPEKRLRIGIDSLRWAERTSTSRLLVALRELSDHLGAAVLRSMFQSGSLVSESEAERGVDVLVGTMTPPPERQVWIVPGRRVDFLWRSLRTVLEYDGEVHRSAERRVQDVERDRELMEAGYLVLHVTKDDVDDPASFLAWLVVTLQRRARELGVSVEISA
jgi:hypothetical protein